MRLVTATGNNAKIEKHLKVHRAARDEFNDEGDVILEFLFAAIWVQMKTPMKICLYSSFQEIKLYILPLRLDVVEVNTKLCRFNSFADNNFRKLLLRQAIQLPNYFLPNSLWLESNYSLQQCR